jgi:hypothetical protein
MKKLTIVAFIALIFASVNTASALAYWDFQGNLPKLDGTRSFHMHEYFGTDGSNPAQVQMSWSHPPSHYMNFIRIHTSGSWEIQQVTPGNPNHCEPGSPYICFWY